MVARAVMGRSMSQAGRQAWGNAVKRQQRAANESLSHSTRQETSSTSSSLSQPFFNRSLSTSSRCLSDISAPAVHLPPLARKDPILYQSLRPPPRSAYVALAHRLKLITRSTDEETKINRLALLVRACTHPSYADLVDRARTQYGEEAVSLTGIGKGVERTEDAKTAPIAEHLVALDSQYLNISADEHNESMASLGNSLLGLIASEYLHVRYPNLPNRVLKAALSAYVGPNTLTDVAGELGITGRGIVRWDGKKVSNGEKSISRDSFADAMRAIIALIFQEQGLSSAREFVHAQLLSRIVPMASLLKFENPKRSLSELMKKLGKERPQSRLIAETGRLSINPVFVVGVWSGMEKLGEGTGSAIRMAEFRAAEDGLRRFYLSESRTNQISLPSFTLDEELGAVNEEGIKQNDQFGFKDIWSIDQLPHKQDSSNAISREYQPAQLGTSEVIFGSKS